VIRRYAECGDPAAKSALNLIDNVELSGFADDLDGTEGWPIGGMKMDLKAGQEGRNGLHEAVEIVPPAMGSQLLGSPWVLGQC
jgi:hypothetical protein